MNDRQRLGGILSNIFELISVHGFSPSEVEAILAAEYENELLSVSNLPSDYEPVAKSRAKMMARQNMDHAMSRNTAKELL